MLFQVQLFQPQRIFSGLAAIILGVCVVSCGGGGSDSTANVDPCSVLKGSVFKVAGGESCPNPPRAIAIVATDSGYCTGTFITTRHILTAAHCVRRLGDRVVVGTRGYAEDATSFVVHPRYDGRVNSPFDVAVVTVADPVDISPVPLKLSQDIAEGDSVVTYGYGVDQEGLDVVNRVQEGGVALKATPLDVVGVSSGTVVSQSDGTGDTCQGDSGGALLLTGVNGEPGIVALVRAGPPGCVRDSGLPSENTNVQSTGVLDFIFARAPGVRTN